MLEFSKYVIDSHGEDLRKGQVNNFTLPYYFHPFQVASLVYKLGFGSKENLLKSQGHDLFEDTKASAKDVLLHTCTEVLEDICHLTKDENIDKKDYMNSFTSKPIDVLIIKICDRLCNVSDFSINDIKYAKIYFNKANCLYEFLQKRQDEVISKYGNNAYVNLIQVINYFKQKLDNNEKIVII